MSVAAVWRMGWMERSLPRGCQMIVLWVRGVAGGKRERWVDFRDIWKVEFLVGIDKEGGIENSF